MITCPTIVQNTQDQSVYFALKEALPGVYLCKDEYNRVHYFQESILTIVPTYIWGLTIWHLDVEYSWMPTAKGDMSLNRQDTRVYVPFGASSMLRSAYYGLVAHHTSCYVLRGSMPSSCQVASNEIVIAPLSSAIDHPTFAYRAKRDIMPLHILTTQMIVATNETKKGTDIIVLYNRSCDPAYNERSPGPLVTDLWELQSVPAVPD